VRALCEALSTFEVHCTSHHPLVITLGVVFTRVLVVTVQGAILAVSHDESFVNKVINAATPGDAKLGGALPRGELWVLSKQRLQRFDGSFSEYKKLITKKVLAGKDF
jgi:hypothetical protein